jgi:hypothetical protein
MPPFKPLTRKGVKVSGGDRVRWKPGVADRRAEETVTVQAESPVLQAASGERSGVIQASQLQNCPRHLIQFRVSHAAAALQEFKDRRQRPEQLHD